MKLQASEDAPGLLWLECFVERSWGMGVEVVQNHPYLLGFGIVLVGQLPHLLGEVARRAPLPEIDMAPRSLRLEEHEQVAHPSLCARTHSRSVWDTLVWRGWAHASRPPSGKASRRSTQ